MTEREALLIWVISILWDTKAEREADKYRRSSCTRALDAIGDYGPELIQEAKAVLKKNQKNFGDPPYAPGTRYGLVSRAVLKRSNEVDPMKGVVSIEETLLEVPE